MALEKQIKRGKIKVSSGDRDGVHPYTFPDFWTNPNNHYWESGYYSQKSKDYLYKALVVPALKEIDKKTKEDLL